MYAEHTRHYKMIGYNYDTIDHGKKQYIRGEDHPNDIEGFCSQLKRSI